LRADNCLGKGQGIKESVLLVSLVVDLLPLALKFEGHLLVFGIFLVFIGGSKVLRVDLTSILGGFGGTEASEPRGISPGSPLYNGSGLKDL
jgi:hypothetical protein